MLVCISDLMSIVSCMFHAGEKEEEKKLRDSICFQHTAEMAEDKDMHGEVRN